MKFFQWLTLLFIALKLLHVIDWPWWWVTAPFWIACILLAFKAVAETNAKNATERLRRRGAEL